MTDGSNFVYWDACIFLAYVKGEQHRLGEIEYLHAQATRFDTGKLKLITSSITVAEIREATLTADQIAKLLRIFRRSNFLFVDVTVAVAELASKIRSYYTAHPILSGDKKRLMLQTPDAIHVASAIVAQKGAKESLKLLTFDSENKPKTNSLALTAISGLVANEFQLVIGRPDVKGFQLKLAPFDPPPPPAPEPLPIEFLVGLTPTPSSSQPPALALTAPNGESNDAPAVPVAAAEPASGTPRYADAAPHAGSSTRGGRGAERVD